MSETNDRKILSTAGIHPWTVNKDFIQQNVPQDVDDGQMDMDIDTDMDMNVKQVVTASSMFSVMGSEEEIKIGLCKCDACGALTAVCIPEDCAGCREVFDLCASCYSSYYSFCPTGYGCNTFAGQNPLSLNHY